MDPQIADMCTHLGTRTCKEIWEYVHLPSNLIQMYDLSFQYFPLQQSDSSVTDYFAAFKWLREELNIVSQLLPITESVQEHIKQREQGGYEVPSRSEG